MKIIKRRKSKIIKIGRISIGDNKPIAIQSMTKTHTKDIGATLRQIKELEAAGCEIIRLSVADFQDARAIKKIKSFCKLPLVADIHFDFRLALAAIDNGIDKIRLNPGNIYKKEQVREIAKAAKIAHIPIRVGVNSGSLKLGNRSVLGIKKSLRPKNYNLGSPTSDYMVQSALNYIKILEGFKFYEIVVSLKSSNIFDTIQAYRKMARLCGYPFHLGMTATGATSYGIIKSAISLGVLLSEGIGDTIRISLTASPEEEVKVAKSILEVMGLRRFGVEIISCPTCGRCEVDLINTVKDIEKKILTSDHRVSHRPIKLAVMGCMVNGPGEVKEADIGIAFGKKEGLLFKRGRPIRKVSVNICVAQLLKEMERLNG